MTNRRHGRRRKLQIAMLLLAIIVALAAVYFAGRWFETRNANKAVRGDHTQRYAYDDLVEIDGESYRRKKSITTILLMGIDRTNDLAVQGYRNGGQADFLRLIALDSESGEISQISIYRDTMTPITVLGVLGNKSGVRTAQISLSHGFGDGKEQSCELTAEAVSNLLMGIPIDFYAAVNLDGISILNDFAGGITVTLEDDFSSLDSAMTAGKTITLVGDQAEYFVRNRYGIGIGTNEARMKRQEMYISLLSEKLEACISSDKEYIGDLYEALQPYMITNISKGRLINEAWAAREYTRQKILAPDGVHTVAEDGFMQFHADEAAIRQIVMDLFYEKIDL